MNSNVNDARILVNGARGRLGQALLNLLPNTVGIDKAELDLTDSRAVVQYFATHTYDIVVHCAAYTDVARAEIERDACYVINVRGTENIVRSFTGKKFVYISTDYVFDGERGNYREEDTPNPINFYSLTKLLGEIAVRQFPRTLIIRTSFKADAPWPYSAAFTDQWTSADYLSVRAPQIAQAILMPRLFGTIHIGGARKTIYQLARQASPAIKKMSLADVPTKLPRDVSLDSSLWKKAQWENNNI